jgi:hypothetical protein
LNFIDLFSAKLLQRLTFAAQTPQLRQNRHDYVPHLLDWKGFLRNIEEKIKR